MYRSSLEMIAEEASFDGSDTDTSKSSPMSQRDFYHVSQETVSLDIYVFKWQGINNGSESMLKRLPMTQRDFFRVSQGTCIFDHTLWV